VQNNDKRLLRLKPFSHSQVVWFRNPYVHIVLVSAAERILKTGSCLFM
jgi:hypothetical protein